MLEHDDRCKRDVEKYEKAVAEFENRWPNYCRHCGAHGETSYSENLAPHGSGRMWMYEFHEPCNCSEDGICPRCGASWPQEDIVKIIEEQLPCPHCGWNWGENEGDTAPYEPECLCYLRR